MAEAEPRIISYKEARAAGLKRYFTGVPCKRGHIYFRSVGRRDCLKCKVVLGAVHRNNDLALARQKEGLLRDKNRLKYRARRRERYSIDPSGQRRREAKWKQSDPAGFRDSQRKKRNKWSAKNRERVKAYKRNWRVRKRRHGNGRHTIADIRDILKGQRGKCACCRRKLKAYHVDHISPLSKGGSNYRNNLQLLCAPCNISKSSHDPIDFMRSRGMLL